MSWLKWNAVTLPWRKGEARVLYWTEAGKESRDHEVTVHPPQIALMGRAPYVLCWVACFAILAVWCRFDLHEAHRRHPMEWGPPR